MNLAHLEDDKLQQYFDGELSAAEAEDVRQALEGSEQGAARLRALGELRSILNVASEVIAGSLSSDDLYSRIRKGIDADKEGGFGEGFEAIEGGDPKPMESWKVWIPMASGLAVAAAVLLMVLRPGPEGPGERILNPTGPAGPLVEAPMGSEVLEVDFGENVGTIFEVEGEAGEAIAVVWINDEPFGEGAP